MAYRRTTKKPNWGRCGFCNESVLPRRLKGTNRMINLSKTVYQILLDDSGEEFFYDGKMVRGREVSDGLTAYKPHRCRVLKRR